MSASNAASNATSARITFVPLVARRPMALPASGSARIVDREHGRALEVLAHAIEYLQDEAMFAWTDGMQQQEHNDSLEAINALKSLSREIWFSLPLREPFWRKMFHRNAHAPVITFPLG